MKRIIIPALLLSGVLGIQGCSDNSAQERPRTIVTCDPELDDNNSMIRFLLHATDFQIDGLVYTSSRFHWTGDGKGTTQYVEGSEYAQLGLGPQTSWRFSPDERFIDDIIDAYEECYPNLKVHDKRYPTPEYLRSVTAWGNCEFEGDFSKDTEGSELIYRNIMDNGASPLFIQAWGGSSTIAAALRKIEETYKGTDKWDEVLAKVNEKVILCLSGDQDNVYNTYIAVNWPNIYCQAFRGGMGTFNNREYDYLTSPEWTAENMRKGPIGALVRCWGDGKQMVPGDVMDVIGPYKGESVQELSDMGYIMWTAPSPIGTLYSDGDSGCYFNLIDNGLKAWKDPSWGGWAGRWNPKDGTPKSAHPTYMRTDIIAMHQRVVNMANGRSGGFNMSLAGFMGVAESSGSAAQFPNMYPERNLSEAARLKWSVTPEYADANHYPSLSGPEAVSAKAGAKVSVKVKASDPDGDALTLKWWNFPVGSYEGETAIADASSSKLEFTMPEDIKPGETIHMVLQATDGELVRYHRVVVTCK